MTSPALWEIYRVVSMPLLVTYRGRPIKRRIKVPSGLKLLFYHPQPFIPGDVLEVTEAEWREHGEIRFLTPDQMPDLWALAARTRWF